VANLSKTLHTISIKIGQHVLSVLRLCTKVFWCVFMPHSVHCNNTQAFCMTAAETFH